MCVEGLDTIVLDLVPGLSATELEARLRSARRTTDVGKRALAFYLHDMDERRAHELLGFGSTVRFAVDRLGLSRRETRDLVSTGRRLRELPKIDRAFADGRISWTKARLLSRVATSSCEDAWLQRALELSCHALEAEVATSEEGRPPRRSRRGIPQASTRVMLRLDPILTESFEKVKKLLGRGSSVEYTDDEAFHALVRGALDEGVASGAIGSRAGAIGTLTGNRCPDCHAATLRTEDGPVELDEPTLERFVCEARIEWGDDPVDPDDPGERDGARAPKTPRRLRERIIARDGRCFICGCDVGLTVHHIVRRLENGPTVESNLVTVCDRCHGRVHSGFLVVEGTAPHAIVVKDRNGRILAGPESKGTDGIRLRIGAPSAATVPPAAGERDGAAAGGARAPLATGSRESTDFESLPDTVDPGWWSRHARLFAWNDRRGAFELTPGPPHEPCGPLRESLRHPSIRLADLVGQPLVVRSLEVACRAARIRGAPLDHVLLLGPAGLGKSTIAEALATELGTRATRIPGQLVRDPCVLVGHLALLSPGDLLFVDEIHSLPSRVAEVLYDAMQDRQLQVAVSDGARSRSLTIALPPFTLVGATTDVHALPPSLLSRFKLQKSLEFYGPVDLAAIAAAAALREGLELERDAALDLGRLAHGVPRRALALLCEVRNEAIARGVSRVDRRELGRALRAGGIDERGLLPVERKVLETLAAERGPVALARLAAKTGLALETLRDVIEPLLVRLGLVGVTPRGRVALGTPPAMRGPVADAESIVAEATLWRDYGAIPFGAPLL